EQTGQKLPTTFAVSSRKGEGRGHFYLRHTPASIALALDSGKDVFSGKEDGKEAWSARMHNAYCVGPLSIHPDTRKPYEVLVEAPIADAPDWLVQWIQSQTESRKIAHAELDGEEPIAEGSRNSALASIGGRARQVLKMDKEELFQFLLSQNQKRCEPPLPESEVRQIANSIGRYDVKSSGPETVILGSHQPSSVPLETEPINPADQSVNSLDWLPVRTLASTRLQDIWLTDFEPYDWPLSLALPALVTAASVVVPRQPRESNLVLGDDPMTNLYTALIADVGAGKSQIIEWAAKAVGIYDAPIGSHYFEGKWGSAEQMLKSLYRKK